MAEEFFIPQLGQTVEEVTLIDWKIEDGAEVDFGQEVLEVETDKAVFPVEANASGTIHKGPFKAGDVVPVLTVVAIIGEPDEKFGDQSAPEPVVETPSAEPAVAIQEQVIAPARAVDGEGDKVFASPRARKLAQAESVDLSQVTATGGGGVRVVEKDVLAFIEEMPRATPVAQKMAAEAGLDLRQVAGSGPGGRVTKEDVELALQQAPAPALRTTVAAPVSLPEIEVLEQVPLTSIKGIVADRMATSVRTTARVTLMMEVDASNFVDMRERLKASVSEEWGFAPGYNDLLAKIVAQALRKYPYVNARLNGNVIEYVAPVNIGMAVDTERGLLVPVVRDADKKNVREFGQEFREMVGRARQGRALPDDLTGGTFTITNLGMYDVDAFTPVINLPEAAILGVGRIAPKVVAREGEMVIRQMWTLSLVHDHRLVDGVPAARFLQYIKNVIEEPYLWLTV